jgi:hypothetical protein
VQQQRPEDEVGKGALVRDALELDLVLRVRLHAQTGREHKLADGGAEAREEGVEGLWGGLLVQCSVLNVCMCVCVCVYTYGNCRACVRVHGRDGDVQSFRQ